MNNTASGLVQPSKNNDKGGKTMFIEHPYNKKEVVINLDHIVSVSKFSEKSLMFGDYNENIHY